GGIPHQVPGEPASPHTLTVPAGGRGRRGRTTGDTTAGDVQCDLPLSPERAVFCDQHVHQGRSRQTATIARPAPHQLLRWPRILQDGRGCDATPSHPAGRFPL
ncbi:hypothetical protein H4R35_007573, partial [Dimargaris xerosporica]